MRMKYSGSSAIRSLSRPRITPHSSDSLAGSKDGTAPSRPYSAPLWTSRVASPPSSTIRVGPAKPLHASMRSVHHQYSSSVSPFHAKTGTPRGSSGVPPVPGWPTTTAAAAWSWVEKMLHEAQRTSAPSAARVSINTAVCTVMCSDPETRAPASGRAAAYLSRSAIRPGISCSANSISRRPCSASPRSRTLKSNVAPRAFCIIWNLLLCLSLSGMRMLVPGGRAGPRPRRGRDRWRNSREVAIG